MYKWILMKREYWAKGNILGQFGRQVSGQPMIFPFVQYWLIFNIHLYMIWHYVPKECPQHLLKNVWGENWYQGAKTEKRYIPFLPQYASHVILAGRPLWCSVQMAKQCWSKKCPKINAAVPVQREIWFCYRIKTEQQSVNCIKIRLLF